MIQKINKVVEMKLPVCSKGSESDATLFFCIQFLYISQRSAGPRRLKRAVTCESDSYLYSQDFVLTQHTIIVIEPCCSCFFAIVYFSYILDIVLFDAVVFMSCQHAMTVG